MTSVNEQERQSLKQQAARMAITDANISQYLAGAAAVVALASPSHAAVLALGAAAMGVCGNYRQAVANDPPRDDFGQIWVSGAAFDASSLDVDESMAVFERFAAQVLLVSDGHYALLRALERYDGATIAGDAAAMGNQALAAGENANRIADLQEALIPLAQELGATVVGLRQGQGFDQITLDMVTSLYKEAWGEPPDAKGETLERIAVLITGAAEDLYEPFDPAQAHPIMSANELPADDSTLLTDDLLSQLSENNATLRALVDA